MNASSDREEIKYNLTGSALFGKAGKLDRTQMSERAGLVQKRTGKGFCDVEYVGKETRNLNICGRIKALAIPFA